ncbi:hypothetical protein T08_11413 [Trichinella sp. T8]|nr:hypothetical protein T08_11413 [Trichinella sp. T8]
MKKLKKSKITIHSYKERKVKQQNGGKKVSKRAKSCSLASFSFPPIGELVSTGDGHFLPIQ